MAVGDVMFLFDVIVMIAVSDIFVFALSSAMTKAKKTSK